MKKMKKIKIKYKFKCKGEGTMFVMDGFNNTEIEEQTKEEILLAGKNNGVSISKLDIKINEV